MAELDTRYSYSGVNIEYIGEAVAGTSPGTARWRIKKLTYSGTDLVIMSWASGSKKFDKRWDIRGTYTYIVT